jgi:hypothetical protein
LENGEETEMTTFNEILRQAGIDPKDVKIARHVDRRAIDENHTPYSLWLADDGSFETYQRIQHREVFKRKYVAAFVGTPKKETLFVGLWRVNGLGKAPLGTMDPVQVADRTGMGFYDLVPDDRLAQYIGRLVIDWGAGYRSWSQCADHRAKPILEIRDYRGCFREYEEAICVTAQQEQQPSA